MENLNPEERPELFFGLVGATGTQLDKVISDLESSLNCVGYKTKRIFLSDYFPLKEFGIKEDFKNAYYRIDGLQTAGDMFRKKYDDGGAVVLLGISEIRKHRESKSKNKHAANKVIPNQAYIIKSLKHPKEVTRLKKIYGENFWLISAYTPRNLRKEYLISRIKAGIVGKKENPAMDAEKLIERDLHDSGNEELGQDVRGTFPLADVFIDVSDSEFKNQLNRFVELIFNNTFRTPTIEEYGMFHAHASSLRSSSLSRQVGASIISDNDELISTGINEVPKFGGGHYLEGDKNDQREFQKGYDSNHVKRNEMFREVFVLLQEARWFKKQILDTKPEELVKQALKSEKLSKMRILKVTEFGREVHAEMSAIVDASRRTISLKNGVLFCTDFPCHVCAKHIIAAGIKKVVYIEPYPKSLAQELFQDSTSVDEQPHNDEVEFNPFVGISPKRYMDLFKMGKRKDENTGKKVDWDSSEAVPRYIETKFYPKEEADELKELENPKKKN